MSKSEYTSTCHLVVKNVGHLWPDNEANRKAGRKTRANLDDGEAKRYGKDLKRLGPAKESGTPENKQAAPDSTK